MKLATKKEHIPNDFIAASRKRLSAAASPHIHEFFEIEFVISGKGVCCIDGHDYVFNKGSVFFLSPINTHEIKSADAEIFNVMFRCDVGDESLFSAPLYAKHCPQIRATGNDWKLLYQLLSELIKTYEHDIDYAKLLLTCISKKLEKLTAEKDHEPIGYIQRALLYITENFMNGMTLSSVAKHVGLTPTYFSNLFKQETGVNFRVYLDNIRFSYAKNLLSFTDFPILEIASLSGFDDYTNFARRFKKLFCLTPGAFRKKARTIE